MRYHIPFWKYEICGNDFILLEDHFGDFPSDDAIGNWVEHLCSRKFGVGGEGVLLLKKLQQKDFSLLFFSSSGKKIPICKDGAFCAAKHIGKKEVTIHVSSSASSTEKMTVTDMGEGCYSALFPPFEKVELEKKISGISPAVHIFGENRKKAVTFTSFPDSSLGEKISEYFSAEGIVVQEKEGSLFASIHPETRRLPEFTVAACATASAEYFLQESKEARTIAFPGGAFNVELLFIGKKTRLENIKAIRIAGFPRFVYKGLGEHYENWNTQRSQGSRIPSRAHS